MTHKSALPTKLIALAGNPNVGKSTLFNALTGLHQHTGNWPGKTVTSAKGTHYGKNYAYIFQDLPGTYSLTPSSAEEEVARDFICSETQDATVVVCDAVCLERNLNLVLQTLEAATPVIVCVNLMDEAKKKSISVDTAALSFILNVPVIPMNARTHQGLPELISTLDNLMIASTPQTPYQTKYCLEIETALKSIPNAKNRFAALKTLDSTPTSHSEISDKITAGLTINAESVASSCIIHNNPNAHSRDSKIDKILTGRPFGLPIMLVLLALILWITIAGANYPSQLLSIAFTHAEQWLAHALTSLHIPPLIIDLLTAGVFRVLAWIISVMFPPMAIFFPLFTLLEDTGLLPRIAFNLDRHLKKAKSCGKQALTMSMRPSSRSGKTFSAHNPLMRPPHDNPLRLRVPHHGLALK